MAGNGYHNNDLLDNDFEHVEDVPPIPPEPDYPADFNAEEGRYQQQSDDFPPPYYDDDSGVQEDNLLGFTPDEPLPDSPVHSKPGLYESTHLVDSLEALGDVPQATEPQPTSCDMFDEYADKVADNVISDVKEDMQQFDTKPLIPEGPAGDIAAPPAPMLATDFSLNPTTTDFEFEKEKAPPTPPRAPSPRREKPKSAGPVAWFKHLSPWLVDLIYWRDVKLTGTALGCLLVVLLSLVFFSVISIFSYLSLAVLTVTISFRLYKTVLQAVQKTTDGHPFKQMLDVDCEIKREKVDYYAEIIVKRVNNALKEARHLYLVEDLVDSLKFALLLWLMTYIGAWFTALTLLILFVVFLFSAPKLYEMYQLEGYEIPLPPALKTQYNKLKLKVKEEIDNYYEIAKTHLTKVYDQVKAKIPVRKEKAQ